MMGKTLNCTTESLKAITSLEGFCVKEDGNWSIRSGEGVPPRSK